MTVAGQALRDGAEWRRRRRALVRTHHPDLGGDPDELLRQLQNLEEELEGRPRYPEVSFVRQPTWRHPVPWVLQRLPMLRSRCRT